jgi:hypothetical protein
MGATEQLTIDRVLRCRRTNRYFTGDNWSSDIAEAASFPTQGEAVRTSIVKDLREIDLLVLARGTAHKIFSARLR